MESTNPQLEALVNLFKINNKDTKITSTDVVPMPSLPTQNRYILIDRSSRADVLYKKLFFKISQKSHENTSSEVIYEKRCS